MKQIITLKFFRKALILSFLVIGLGFAVFSNNTVRQVIAAPGCCTCMEMEQWCWENSGHPGDPYQYFYQCAEDYGVWDCYSNCIPEPPYCP